MKHVAVLFTILVLLAGCQASSFPLDWYQSGSLSNLDLFQNANDFYGFSAYSKDYNSGFLQSLRNTIRSIFYLITRIIGLPFKFILMPVQFLFFPLRIFLRIISRILRFFLGI